MNIGGVDQVLSEGFSKELVRQMRLIRINHGGGDIAQLSPEEINEIGQVVKSASKRIRKLHLGRSKGAAWCRAETKSLFRSRDFLTAAALIQSVKREQILGLEEARHLAEQARDLSWFRKRAEANVPLSNTVPLKASGTERSRSWLKLCRGPMNLNSASSAEAAFTPPLNVLVKGWSRVIGSGSLVTSPRRIRR